MAQDETKLLRRASLALALLALASCSFEPPVDSYHAKYGAGSVELEWRHRTPEGFQDLALECEPGRVGVDLPIDGDAVLYSYQHGRGDAQCPLAHRVTGTLRLLEHAATDVRARLDAVLRCPDNDPVPLKGEFTFAVRSAP